MKPFFRTFILSLTRPAYYKDVLQARFRFSVKYYIVLSALLILVSTVAGVINYSASVRDDFTITSKEVVQDFPSDLVLTITPTGITANKNFPLIAQMPSVLMRSWATPASTLKNLAVIDPNGEIAYLEKYHALMLINNSYVVVGSGESIQTTPLKDFPEIRLDYPKMHQFSQTLLLIAHYAIAVTAGYFALTGLVSFFVWRLLYIAIFAFGLKLVCIYKHKSTVGTYSKAFQVSLHSITLPVLISTTLEIAGTIFSIPVNPFPGWFMIVHTIFTFYILSRLEKKP